MSCVSRTAVSDIHAQHAGPVVMPVVVFCKVKPSKTAKTESFYVLTMIIDLE